jgi:hypothetical protein
MASSAPDKFILVELEINEPILFGFSDGTAGGARP